MNIVFVGGAPRSGTSLLQKMLGFHSDILAGPEFENIYDVVQLYKRMKATNERDRHEFYCGLDDIKQEIEQLVLNLLTARSSESDCRLIIEKTPKNVLVFNELREIFPKAKFIFVLRDPRATVASLKLVSERMKTKAIKSAFGRGIETDIKLTRTYLDHGLKFFSENSDICHMIRYEHLVSDPEGQMEAVCQFMGVEYQEVMLDVENPNRAGQRLDRKMNPWNLGENIAKKISTTGIEKWKGVLNKYESNLVALYFTGHPFLKEFYDIQFKKSFHFYIKRFLSIIGLS